MMDQNNEKDIQILFKLRAWDTRAFDIGIQKILDRIYRQTAYDHCYFTAYVPVNM